MPAFGGRGFRPLGGLCLGFPSVFPHLGAAFAGFRHAGANPLNPGTFGNSDYGGGHWDDVGSRCGVNAGDRSVDALQSLGGVIHGRAKLGPIVRVGSGLQNRGLPYPA